MHAGIMMTMRNHVPLTQTAMCTVEINFQIKEQPLEWAASVVQRFWFAWLARARKLSSRRRSSHIVAAESLADCE